MGITPRAFEGGGSKLFEREREDVAVGAESLEGPRKIGLSARRSRGSTARWKMSG